MNVYYIDLFSGIGGFHLGLQQSGFKFKKCFHSEINKYAKLVYQKQFPDSEDLGDVKAINVSELPEGKYIVSAGWPCQDNSIAGKRKGQSGGLRSGLFSEVVRILSGLVQVGSEVIFIGENVKGLYSVNKGVDFYDTITRLTFLDTGMPQLTLEVQLCNTRWFLPQNRERIYFVGISKNLQFKSILPIIPDKYIGEIQYERMFEVSQKLSRVFEIFLKRQQIQKETNKMVSKLFQRIRQGIQQGEAKEINQETDEIRQFGEEGIFKTETIISRISGYDNSGRVFEVVQIPTEEMLLLWYRGSNSSYRFRFSEPQDTSFDDRQNGFKERICKGEHGALLLSVQLYKGRLFYSIGDGRNWTKIYIQEVGRCQQTLSDILEVEVNQKYFLSEKAQEYIKRRTEQTVHNHKSKIIYQP